MKLRPIFRADMHAAVALLTEGFPVQAWQDSLGQLFRLVGQDCDGSIGHIASADGRDVGICLSIPSIRFAYEPAPRKVVNLAGFYLRPGHEWMTGLFMRRIMKDASVEYVDITASEAMRQVIRRLGFTDRTSGMVVVPTALTALRPGRGARIVPMSELSPGQMAPDHIRLLEHHARLSAICLAVETAGEYHPLILVRGRRRRLGSARVLLARDRELIRAAAGPLSRWLLRQSIAFLEFDSPSPVPISGAAFITRAAPVQTTWPTETAAIDHTYSELLFIPPPNRRPGPSPLLGLGSSARPFPFGITDLGIVTAPSASAILGLAEMMPV